MLEAFVFGFVVYLVAVAFIACIWICGALICLPLAWLCDASDMPGNTCDTLSYGDGAGRSAAVPPTGRPNRS